MKDSIKIYLLMILTTIFWAGAFIAAKLSSPYIPVFTLTFLRFSLATIILYFIIKIKDKKVYKPTKKDIPAFLFTGIIGMFGYHIFFFSSVKYTTAINSSIIGASNPIITTILCVIFLKEKVNYKRIFGIILSFIGVFLTITNAKIETIKNISLNKGDILMLVAVLLWSIYMVYSKKISKNYTPITLIFYSFLVCTLFLIPFVLYETPLKYVSTIPYYSYIAIIYMSIFPSVIGYLIQQMSIKEIGPGKTSVFNNLVPVFSIILSILILGETITVIKLFTTALIISGVYICQKN
ncbi:putative inner membrane transporter YhbE [Clostridium acetireducens DSM 10703]|uniref:Putative inner membrane transporter YhbE n=1 Tax=Clostridium acetireducens DSM 10703 TaxID=1121290 RepID=A0A1E8EZ38_9CLOT|nr:DMT family transporter [Clostridium acetireducens]OFI06253.1 putative inner membrane transporter YhbE [Clostridium acetireducens DSM 10703]